jgi:hypothetical protein
METIKKLNLEWEKLIERQIESGLSRKQFCKQENLGIHTFSYPPMTADSVPSKKGDETYEIPRRMKGQSHKKAFRDRKTLDKPVEPRLSPKS